MAEAEGTPDGVIVAHAIHGRTRLRLPRGPRRAALAAELAQQLSAHPKVRSAQANPRTGSVLLEHDGALADIAADLPVRLVPRLAAPARPNPPARPGSGFQALAAGCALLSAAQLYRGRLFGTALENAWNAWHARRLKAPPLAAALLAGGVIQLANRQVMPSAASLLFYAFRLHRLGRIRAGRTGR